MRSEGSVGLSVGRSVCRFVGLSASRTVAAVDTKRGYVGMCNGYSAVWSGVVQEQHVYGGGQKLYTAITLGVY